jgi:hypothetical protein
MRAVRRALVILVSGVLFLPALVVAHPLDPLTWLASTPGK